MNTDKPFQAALDIEMKAMLKRLQAEAFPDKTEPLATRTRAAQGLLRFERFLPRYGISQSRIEKIRQIAHGKG